MVTINMSQQWSENDTDSQERRVHSKKSKSESALCWEGTFPILGSATLSRKSPLDLAYSTMCA